jgi:PIN domain nuclease of toxin-antitoxin system
MKLLVDTSAFLWFVSDSDRLPLRTRTVLRDPEVSVSLSVISLWEIAVKQQIGRLTLPGPAWPYVTSLRHRHGIDSLSLDERALAHLAKLPDVHRDPFDRMLVCQAIEHDLLLVTNDEHIHVYPVKTLWLT